jgi:hypothetical protein
MVRWLNSKVSVGVPEELYDKIKLHPEIKWAAVCRKAMTDYLKMIEEAKRKQAADNNLDATRKP